MINFEEIDGGQWTEEEKRAAHDAALAVGRAFARVHNEANPDNQITAEQAFLMAFEGKVTFIKSGGHHIDSNGKATGRAATAGSDRSITFYTYRPKGGEAVTKCQINRHHS